ALAHAVEDQRAVEAARPEPALDDRPHLTLEAERATRPVLGDGRRDPEDPRRAGAIENVPGEPCDLSLSHSCAVGPRDEVPDPVVRDVLQQRLAIGPLEEAAAHVVHRERGEVRHAEDPAPPVFGVRTMESLVASALAERRFPALLSGVFAGVAL